MNKLYYGDNLSIMRQMPVSCVDLIYLDPPFNSKKNYNLMYKNMTGQPVREQADAFCDTWEMDPVKEEVARTMPVLMREHGVDNTYVEFWRVWMRALRQTQPHLLAYLIYMVERLLYMKTILRPHGAIYLHCDPTASHYIKIMMDGIFGHQNFRNEIIWKRTGAHGGAKRYGPIHDVILFYSKSDKYVWNRVFQPYDESYTEAKFGKIDEKTGKHFQDVSLTGPGVRTGESGQPWRGFDPTAIGRHWQPASYLYQKYFQLTGVELKTFPFLERLDRLDEQGLIYWGEKKSSPRYKQFLEDAAGLPLQDVWTDISAVNSQADERLGYPTQKPIALLDRIIQASSKPGDIVFDPFCGCGTTIYSAEKNKRAWIGCDIAILSIRLVSDILAGEKYRLVDGKHFEVDGIPVTVEQAEILFKHDPFQFQHWFVEKIGGFPLQKKVADRGIDGRLYFETMDGLKDVILSVKGGAVRPTDLRDLRGVLDREKDTAAIGGFLSLREPSKAMKQEAASAGMYAYQGTDYPRMQLLTVREVLEEKRGLLTPSRVGPRTGSHQSSLALGVP